MPIFDQGYQHWSGELAGHAWRWLAITKHGVRVGMKSRMVRVVLLGAWTPALALAIVLSIWGLLERKADVIKPLLASLAFLGKQMIADPRAYRLQVWTVMYDYFLLIELRLSMILILLIGPNLISLDLRFNALPLYFSRPLRRIDYFLGKLGVIATYLVMIVIGPSIVAYVLGLAFSLDITIIRDTYRLLFSSILYGLIIAISAGLLCLALSSLSRNSRYIALFWLGIWLVSSITSGVLQDIERGERRREYYERNEIRKPVWMRGNQKVHEDLQVLEFRAAKNDWRPIVSYTTNLQRIGQQLLGTNKAWQDISMIRSPSEREPFLAMYMGPQYPWYWSLGVLVGLFGISACILNFRVRSLDRLK